MCINVYSERTFIKDLLVNMLWHNTEMQWEDYSQYSPFDDDKTTWGFTIDQLADLILEINKNACNYQAPEAKN